MSVLKGPLNGIGDWPVVQGVGMDEMEAGRWRGKDALGKEHRPGDGGGGFQQITTGWHVGSFGNGP